MYKFESSVYIQRPPEEVFEYYSDPANQRNWQSGLESAEWTSEGPHGAGSTLKTVSNFLGRKIDADLEITAWTRPGRWPTKRSMARCRLRPRRPCRPRGTGPC
jgi:hypothetical protein